MATSLTAAFTRYGAELRNPRWAVSSIAPDGALVLSCWDQFFETMEGGGMRYSDTLSRWSQDNPNGSSLCRDHLQSAFDQVLPVRLVIASAKDKQAVEAGNASTTKVSFQARKTHTGRVVEFDGDRLVIEFRRESE